MGSLGEVNSKLDSVLSYVIKIEERLVPLADLPQLLQVGGRLVWAGAWLALTATSSLVGWRLVGWGGA